MTHSNMPHDTASQRTVTAGMYVAVQVGGFTDHAGNPLDSSNGDFLTWGFQVGQFDTSDLTLTIPGLGLSQPLSTVTGVLGSTVGHRRLLAQPDAASLPTAVDLSAPLTSYWSAGTKASAVAQFETQLEAQVQVEVVRLITAWFAASGRVLSATDLYPSQVALDNVRTKPVSFDVMLLPAAAATVSPAEAAHAFVSAMEAAVLAGPASLDNQTYPLLSMHAVKAKQGLDGITVVDLHLRVTNLPEPGAGVTEPVVATVAAASSSGGIAIGGPAWLSAPASSSVAGWLWPALAALLGALLLLVLIVCAKLSASLRRLSTTVPAVGVAAVAVPAEEVQQADSSVASELEPSAASELE